MAMCRSVDRDGIKINARRKRDWRDRIMDMDG